MCDHSEALKTTRGNETFLEMRRKLFVVTKSGVTRGWGSGEQSDIRLVMSRIKDRGTFTGQLNMPVFISLLRQACHPDLLRGRPGVRREHPSQQDVIKGRAANSKRLGWGTRKPAPSSPAILCSVRSTKVRGTPQLCDQFTTNGLI